ncbi:Branched-chain amino acid aminotransferase [hydrothermal vent metagenome]|uniref:Branched-chain amino acid aminotransferase n=1 Tax=hydrothermal vent metagenome TaxID=652676 RepID=A0A3B0R6V3_9ZZZZ
MSKKSLAFTQTQGDIWLNGEFIPIKQANIPLLSHGLHYGSTVFEGERAYDGKIFKSDQHTRRLMRSCNLLGFDLPVDFETFEQAKRDLLQRSGLQKAYFRAIAWKGSGALGVGSSNNRVNAAISLWPMESYFDTASAGIRLDISAWQRPPPACAPVKAKAAGLYMICTLSKDKAMDNGYDDALMLDIKGRVSECTGAHIFFVRDGALFTPQKHWMIDGITRASIIEIAKTRQIKVTETEIWPDDISGFSECFIVGSAVEVVPVTEIKGTMFSPDSLSQQMVDDYQAMVYGRLG